MGNEVKETVDAGPKEDLRLLLIGCRDEIGSLRSENSRLHSENAALSAKLDAFVGMWHDAYRPRKGGMMMADPLMERVQRQIELLWDKGFEGLEKKLSGQDIDTAKGYADNKD